MTTTRETFAARFGEDQAQAVEAAAREHFSSSWSDAHSNDDFGSDEFRYWFLLAIGFECVSRDAFRQEHGITADVEQMKEWARGEGQLAAHNGDIPDYLAAMAGAYSEWVSDPEVVSS